MSAPGKIPLLNQPEADEPHCPNPKCGKPLLFSHAMGHVVGAPMVVAQAWCTHCKHLLTFQFFPAVAAPPPQKDPN